MKLAGILAALLLTPTVVLATPAAAAPDLSSVVISHSLPGLMESPPGPENGPITPSNIGVLGPVGRTATLSQQLANGNLSVYLRTWKGGLNGGDLAAIVAIGFNDTSLVPAFLAGVDTELGQGAASTFPVPQISGASGFIFHLPVTQSGEIGTQYVVAFTRSNDIFFVQVTTVLGDLSMDDAISLASSQAAQASGDASSGSVGTSDALIGGLAFIAALAVLVIAFVVVLVRRGRPRRTPGLAFSVDSGVAAPSGSFGMTRPPGATANGGPSTLARAAGAHAATATLPTFDDFARPGAAMPSPAVAPTQPAAFQAFSPGWYPDAEDGSLLRYFDGHTWTGHTAPRRG